MKGDGQEILDCEEFVSPQGTCVFAYFMQLGHDVGRVVLYSYSPLRQHVRSCDKSEYSQSELVKFSIFYFVITGYHFEL